MDRTEASEPDIGWLATELKELQRTIAFNKLLNDPSGNPDKLSVLIMKFDKIQIRMEGDKVHGRPHIHIRIGKQHHSASYAVDTGQRLAGKRTKYENIVSSWVEKHRKKLNLTWEAIQAGKDATTYIEEIKADN